MRVRPNTKPIITYKNSVSNQSHSTKWKSDKLQTPSAEWQIWDQMKIKQNLAEQFDQAFNTNSKSWDKHNHGWLTQAQSESQYEQATTKRKKYGWNKPNTAFINVKTPSFDKWKFRAKGGSKAITLTNPTPPKSIFKVRKSGAILTHAPSSWMSKKSSIHTHIGKLLLQKH